MSTKLFFQNIAICFFQRSLLWLWDSGRYITCSMKTEGRTERKATNIKNEWSNIIVLQLDFLFWRAVSQIFLLTLLQPTALPTEPQRLFVLGQLLAPYVARQCSFTARASHYNIIRQSAGQSPQFIISVTRCQGHTLAVTWAECRPRISSGTNIGKSRVVVW